MGTFADGESGSSVRTKINTAIEKTEGTTAISTINVDGGAIDGVTLGTNSAVTEAQVDNININGNTISSTNTNGDVTIDPNGTGDVNVGNFKFDADQTVGAGQDNYVLTYDNSGGKISLEAAAGGGGGGAWNLISTTTVSSAVTSIEFTSVSGYKSYALDFRLATAGSNLSMRFGTGSTYDTGTNYGSSNTAFQLTSGPLNQGIYGLFYIRDLERATTTNNRFGFVIGTYARTTSSDSGYTTFADEYKGAQGRNSIQLFAAATNGITEGTVSLYGLSS